MPTAATLTLAVPAPVLAVLAAMPIPLKAQITAKMAVREATPVQLLLMMWFCTLTAVRVDLRRQFQHVQGLVPFHKRVTLLTEAATLLPVLAAAAQVQAVPAVTGEAVSGPRAAAALTAAAAGMLRGEAIPVPMAPAERYTQRSFHWLLETQLARRALAAVILVSVQRFRRIIPPLV